MLFLCMQRLFLTYCSYLLKKTFYKMFDTEKTYLMDKTIYMELPSLLRRGFNTAKIKARGASARFPTEYGVEPGRGGGGDTNYI